MAGPPRSASSTPAAGWPGGDDARRQGERARPSGRSPTPTSSCSSSTSPSASPRRTTGSPTLLRRLGQPVLRGRQQGRRRRPRDRRCGSFVSLGLGEPYPVSALHGRGTGDLLDALVDRLPAPTEPTPTTTTTPDADAGGDDDGVARRSPSSAGPTWASRRCSTGSSARTARSCTTCRARPATRSTPSSRPSDGPIRFVDTAGMRRKVQIDEGTEYYSLVRALQAVDEADVALLVIDATEGVTHQDQRLAERIDAAGCPVVVAAQQVGAARRRAAGRRDAARSADRLHFLGDAPVLKISALSGKGVHKLLPGAGGSDRGLPPPGPDPAGQPGAPRRPRPRQPAPDGARVLYATQGATDPPTFTLFANRELPAHLPALPRAQAPRGLRPRRHAGQAAGPPAR